MGPRERSIRAPLPGSGDERTPAARPSDSRADQWAPGRRRASDLEEIVRELRASEARTRELIEFSGDGILVSDAAGRYVEANPAFCRMLGYLGAQLLRLHAGDLAASDDPIGLHGMRDRIGEATGEFGVLVKRRYRKRDGTVRFRSLRRRPSTSRVRSRSAAWRTLMSRIAAVTMMPSDPCRGLSMISIGNSVPSLRRPTSSMPMPICWAIASAADRRSSATSRAAKPAGMMFVTG